MEQMPEYREGYITLWREGKWISIPLSELPKIIEEDNRGIENSTELPVGA